MMNLLTNVTLTWIAIYNFSDMYARDFEINKTCYNLKVFVRSFTDSGIVIPRDDDIVWSLQLLAYISKYPYLKDCLQNSHLVLI